MISRNSQSISQKLKGLVVNISEDEQDPIAEWLVRSMRIAQTGTIKLDIEGQPAVKININNNGNKMMVDLLQPAFFRTTDDEIGLFDKLKTAKEFAKKLTDNGMTISFLRRGEEGLTLGKSRTKLFLLIPNQLRAFI